MPSLHSPPSDRGAANSGHWCHRGKGCWAIMGFFSVNENLDILNPLDGLELNHSTPSINRSCRLRLASLFQQRIGYTVEPYPALKLYLRTYHKSKVEATSLILLLCYAHSCLTPFTTSVCTFQRMISGYSTDCTEPFPVYLSSRMDLLERIRVHSTTGISSPTALHRGMKVDIWFLGVPLFLSFDFNFGMSPTLWLTLHWAFCQSDWYQGIRLCTLPSACWCMESCLFPLLCSLLHCWSV